MKNPALFLMLVSKNLHNEVNTFSPTEHLMLQNSIEPEVLFTWMWPEGQHIEQQNLKASPTVNQRNLKLRTVLEKAKLCLSKSNTNNFVKLLYWH